MVYLRTIGASLAGVALAFGCGGNARADVGQSTSLAIAAVAARSTWRHVVPRTGHIGGDESAPSYRIWDRDAEPEERRYQIVFGNERSAEETFGGRASVAHDPFAGSANGLKAAVSSAAFADFRAAVRVATVTSAPLKLTQTFYRGKKWAFILGRSGVAAHGVSTFSWTEIAPGSLADRVRAARACAKTGECGE